jgi:hypothetical protein
MALDLRFCGKLTYADTLSPTVWSLILVGQLLRRRGGTRIVGGPTNSRVRTSFFQVRYVDTYLVSVTSPAGVKPFRVFDYLYAHPAV